MRTTELSANGMEGTAAAKHAMITATNARISRQEIYPASLNAEASLGISVRSRMLAARRAATMERVYRKKNVLTEPGKALKHRRFW
jgi:hypothetical protein